MENLLVSACLLGVCCRYDGQSKPVPAMLALRERFHLIPVCPEQLGGLPTPRPPAQRQGECVITENGQDMTAQYIRGAEEVLKIARLFQCKKALLKEKSPSCGCRFIYDGTFSGRLIPGHGVTADVLKAHGIRLFSENETDALLECEYYNINSYS